MGSLLSGAKVAPAGGKDKPGDGDTGRKSPPEPQIRNSVRHRITQAKYLPVFCADTRQISKICSGSHS
jgi:hypothetical protein